jgi:hypothetical protein
MRGLARAILAVALLAWAVDASLLLRQDANISPSASIPAVFASNDGITTILGTDATSATVNDLVLLLATTADTLRIASQSNVDWSVQLTILSATGLQAQSLPLVVGDNLIIGITNGTAQTVTLTSATTYPQTTGFVTLAPGGPQLNITARNTAIAGCGGASNSCTVTMQALFTPSPTSGPAPRLAYNYTLNIL